MENFIYLAEHFDNCGDYELSDKLFKIAQLSTVLPNNSKGIPKYLKALNPMMGIALSPEGLAIEKKVIDEAQANPVYQGASKVQELSEQVKSPVSNAKTIASIGNLTGWFTKNIPSMIKTLDAAEQKLDVFSKYPLAQKVFQTLDIVNLIKDSVEFLTNIYKSGFNAMYKNDPGGVTKYLARIVSTFTNPNLTKYFPPILPLQPQLMALNTLSSGMGLMVSGAESLGTFYGNMENKGSNRIEQIPQAQAYTSQGMKAKGATMPLDELALKYGEVYNVLLDYVNKKATVPEMITKLGNEPGRMALMSAHIAQGILPPANGQYQISSYKRARDQAQKQNQKNYVYSPGSGGMGYSR